METEKGSMEHVNMSCINVYDKHEYMFMFSGTLLALLSKVKSNINITLTKNSLKIRPIG